jgi:hypothetical protein
MYFQLFDFLPQDVGPLESTGQSGIAQHRRKLERNAAATNDRAMA